MNFPFDLAVVGESWYLILILAMAVMLTKAALLFGTLSLFIQKRTALKTALALMQVGEFALAIFALAAQSDLIAPRTNQILIVTVVLTMIATPFVLNRLKSIADALFAKEPERDYALTSRGYHDHVIVCGYGQLGQKLAKKLKKLGLTYLIIEHEYDLVRLAEAHLEPILMGNAMERVVLEAAGIKSAMAVVVAIDNAAKTRMVADAVTTVAPEVNTIVKVQNASHQKIIETFPVNHIVNVSDVVSDAILKEVLACRLTHI